MVASKQAHQSKKEESERLRGGRDHIKFTDIRFLSLYYFDIRLDIRF